MAAADMDFAVAPAVEDAIRARAAYPGFGCTSVPDTWYDAYLGWWKQRHDLELRRDALLFCRGVIPTIGACIRDLTAAGDCVVIQTPICSVLSPAIRSNGRNVLENPLWYHNGRYSIDFRDLEAKLSDPSVTMMILCNPHSPTGQTWSCEDLVRIAQLCRQNGVILISDETHCDITAPGISYTPLDSVPEEELPWSVTLLSPARAFNIEGLGTAAAYVPDDRLRRRIKKALDTYDLARAGSFSVPAAEAAFREGSPWLDAMRAYVSENRLFAEKCLTQKMPLIHAVSSDCTYFIWLDVEALTRDAARFAADLRQETGLSVSAGTPFGGNGNHFLCINIACSRSRVMDGMKRLAAFVSFAPEP